MVLRKPKSKVRLPGWFIRYCFVSGFDGLRFVVSVHHILGRIMWIILTILAAVAVGHYSQMVIADFGQKTIATSVSIGENSTVNLPKLFLFSHSRINDAKRVQMGVSVALAQYLQISFALSSTFSLFLYKATLGFTQNITNMMMMERELAVLMATRNSSLDQIITELSNKCENFIDFCAVGGVQYDCCAIAQHFLTSYGMGIMIPTPKQQGDGSEAGIKVGLKLNSENRTAAPNGGWGEGFLLKFFEANSDVEMGSTTIATGKLTQIEVKAIQYDLLNDKRSPCHENANGLYRRIICAYTCDFKPAILACNCSPAGLATLRKYLSHSVGVSGRVCTPVEIFQCFLPASQNPNISNPDEAAQCLKSCPPMCRRTEYEKSVTSYELSPRMARVYMGNATADRWKNEYAMLSVFFPNTQVTTLKQFYATSFIEAFGVFAGQFGLWLGSSVLGVLHLAIWVLFEVIQKCCK